MNSTEVYCYGSRQRNWIHKGLASHILIPSNLISFLYRTDMPDGPFLQYSTHRSKGLNNLFFIEFHMQKCAVTVTCINKNPKHFTPFTTVLWRKNPSLRVPKYYQVLLIESKMPDWIWNRSYTSGTFKESMNVLHSPQRHKINFNICIYKIHHKGWGCSSQAESLPSTSEALGTILSTA